MTLSDQEFKVKTAKLAGYEECSIYGQVSLYNDKIGNWFPKSDWNPEENIEQAMEVLEAYYKNGNDEGVTQFTFDCMYHDRPIMGFWLQSNHGEHPADSDSEGWDFQKMFCECICNAVKSYLEGEG